MKAQKKADEKAQKVTTVPQTQSSATKEAASTGAGENDEQDIDPNVREIVDFDCQVNLIRNSIGILQDACPSYSTTETSR